MSPLAVVPSVSSIAVISSSTAGGGFEVGSGDFGMVIYLRSGMKKPLSGEGGLHAKPFFIECLYLIRSIWL